jgi:hypothetical protein
MIVKVEFMYEDDTEYICCPAKIGRTIDQIQSDLIYGLVLKPIRN